MTEPLRDKNGLTEEEFLAAYSPKDYPRPSLTADNCIFRVGPDGTLKLLLIRRGGHPFLGCWALPGGFVSPGETALEASRRELLEETGVEGLALEPVGLYSTPGRDPRGWTISQAHIAVDSHGVTAHAGDDAAAAAWFDVASTEKDGHAALTYLRRHHADQQLCRRARSRDGHPAFARRTRRRTCLRSRADHRRRLAAPRLRGQ